jgi:predicted TIM-barrel fold metal-dependent hydrolase
MYDDAVAALGRHDDSKLARAVSHDPHRLIAFMDERNIERLVMINYMSPAVVGFTESANEHSAKMAEPYPERLIPFGGVDPRRVADVAAEMDYLLGELKLQGIKLHPPHQLFHANDYLHVAALQGLATVYQKCVEYDVPVMVHTGTSVFPRARNKYGRPLDLDDLVVDFPALKIIVAHGGRPFWMEEAFFVLRRSRNVYLDISSVPPKSLLRYFPWLERVAERTMFGSDWPGPGVPDPLQNIEDFYDLPLAEEAKRQILYETANRLFAT